MEPDDLEWLHATRRREERAQERAAAAKTAFIAGSTGAMVTVIGNGLFALFKVCVTWIWQRAQSGGPPHGP